MAGTGRRAGAGAVALASFVALTAFAQAQTLPRLHVTSLGMHADRTRVRPGEPFHVTINVVVKEPRAEIAPILILPNLENLDDLGDARQTSRGPQGTVFVETLTLAARGPGTATLSPAYLDAIDGRNGRPSRFSSASLTIAVAGEAVPIDRTARAAGEVMRQALRVALVALVVVLLVAALVVAVALTARRRRRPAKVAPAVVAPAVPPAPPPSPRERLAAALAAFRTAPGVETRRRVRDELFALCGTPPGATLADALPRAHDPRLRAALLAAERAVFGPAPEREMADADLLEAASGWT